MDASAKIGRHGPVVIAVLEVEGIGDSIEPLAQEIEVAAAEHPGAGRLLLCVRGRLGLPSKRDRARMQALLRRATADVNRIALVLVGRPFWVSAARSGLAVFFSEIRRSAEVEVFDQTAAAAEFVAGDDEPLRDWVEARLG